MPKSQLVDPREVRKAGKLTLGEIPLNAYAPDFNAELKKYGRDGLKKILYDMMIIREFETMLNEFKTKGAYRGVEYNHPGPAHLSIGQESASVGQCYYLGVEDFIFGSHRSHGEILAKCFSAIPKLEEAALEKIMKEYFNGEVLAVVEKEKYSGLRDLAENFILYSVLAEIFVRKYGVNRGLGGSMHAFFIPFGSMPNNAIVGGSGDICVGSALYKRINKKLGIVIGNIGDASMGCGPVWEGITLASMDQYRKLWAKDIGGAPPVLFNFFNNFYGMGGQTCGETMGYEILARVGAGVNPDNLHAERVDGYNPLAVADAIERKKKILLEGRGPVLLDTITYRISGHSPSDASSYRSREEVQLWEAMDCVQSFRDYLVKNNVLSSQDAEELSAKVTAKITAAVKQAVSLETSPRVAGEFIGRVMFSNTFAESLEPGRKPDVLLPITENPRSVKIAAKSRFGLDAEGKPLPKLKVVNYRDALFEAVLHRF